MNHKQPTRHDTDNPINVIASHVLPITAVAVTIAAAAAMGPAVAAVAAPLALATYWGWSVCKAFNE